MGAGGAQFDFQKSSHLQPLASSSHLEPLASGCKWLQVAASGCKWLQVAAWASGCKWLQVAAWASGWKWLQVAAWASGCLGKWLLGQVAASDCFFENQNHSRLLAPCEF